VAKVTPRAGFGGERELATATVQVTRTA
jgi:hypothetical protein